MRQKVFLIFLFVIVVCSIIFFVHHFSYYEVASVLKTPIKSFANAVFPPNGKLAKIKHVFIIVEENHDWSTIYNSPDAPYINTLVTKGAHANQYYNISQELPALHPSEPSYIMLEAGQIAFLDNTFTTDNNPSKDNATKSVSHISSLLEKNGYTWKSYQEDISGNDCPIQSTSTYAAKHNPFIFFQDVSGNPPSSTNEYCKSHVRPFSELQNDLVTGNIPNYVFITPNTSHDMHNGSITEADTWLSQTVPLILTSQTYKRDGALFITWDEGSEDSDRNDPIGMIGLSPFIKANYSNAISYSHASYVKTVEEIFGLSPLLGMAGNPKTHDLLDFFK